MEVDDDPSIEGSLTENEFDPLNVCLVALTETEKRHFCKFVVKEMIQL